jgi:hypothetical protein
MSVFEDAKLATVACVEDQPAAHADWNLLRLDMQQESNVVPWRESRLGGGDSVIQFPPHLTPRLDWRTQFEEARRNNTPITEPLPIVPPLPTVPWGKRVRRFELRVPIVLHTSDPRAADGVITVPIALDALCRDIIRCQSPACSSRDFGKGGAPAPHRLHVHSISLLSGTANVLPRGSGAMTWTLGLSSDELEVPLQMPEGMRKTSGLTMEPIRREWITNAAKHRFEVHPNGRFSSAPGFTISTGQPITERVLLYESCTTSIRSLEHQHLLLHEWPR